MHSLQNSNSFTLLKELLNFRRTNFNNNRNFVISSELDDLCVGINHLNDTFTALELTLKYFDAITHLNAKLRVISNSLKDNWVR